MADNQWFENVDVAPKIEVFALTGLYHEDIYPRRVNLSVGGKYRTFMYGAIAQ